MDETYIKMCDCPEIQEQWEPQEGDRLSKGVSIWCIDGIAARCYEADDTLGWQKESVIWLPRQEDIQEMLGLDIKRLSYELYWFLEGGEYEKWDEEADSIVPKYSSMAELWLALYMNFAHKKQWTDEGW